MADAKEVEVPTAVAVATPVTAVATPVPTPFGQGMANAGAAPGPDFLLGQAGLYVRQHIEILELMTGCEAKNRYSFAPIPAGTGIPKDVGHKWSKKFRQAAGFNPLLKAKEDGECFERICCPLFRGFKMHLKDGNGTAFLTLDRPCKFDLCYPPGCLSCNTQEMTISSASGLIATAKETTGPCCTSGCCQRTFAVYDKSGNLKYKMAAPECCSVSNGCNFCSPSCINEAFTIDVTDANGAPMPASTFVWPGCNCAGMTDLSNIIMVFPEGSSAEDRAGIVVGLMLIEFAVMEFKRQQNNNNNGGGGGGGPPQKNDEMVR